MSDTTAGNKETPASQADLAQELKSSVDSKLAEVQAQLDAMNRQFMEGFQAMKRATQPEPSMEVSDDDVFDPKRLKEKVLSEAKRTATEMLQEERKKNSTIYNLAKEYPEINTDQSLQKAILDAQKSLPVSLQDTAEGYELAVMKAVAQQGVLPKSKRAAKEIDPDVSAGSRGGRQERSQAKKKLSENTLRFAELLRGRELTEEEMKNLEKAAQRDDYLRYR